MSYGFDLVRLPPGVNPEAEYRQHLRETEEQLTRSRGEPGAIDSYREEVKRRLARELVARHPSLRIAQLDLEERARVHGIDLSEAKRRFRDIELNEERYSIQITLFDDAAGVSFSFDGTVDDCKEAVRFLWNCLKTLHTEGGFSVFDPQVDKLLDLESDRDLVMKTICGRRA